MLGATIGALQLALAWGFFKLIRDIRAMWLVSLISVASCVIAAYSWALRPDMLADPYYDTLTYTWLGVLLAGIGLATWKQHRLLR